MVALQVYIGWQWSSFFMPFMQTVSPPWCKASSEKCLLLWVLFMASLSQQDSDNTDIFLSQLIQFYSNNATNLRPLTQYAVLPHNIEIVFWPQTSLHPMYTQRKVQEVNSVNRMCRRLVLQLGITRELFRWWTDDKRPSKLFIFSCNVLWLLVYEFCPLAQCSSQTAVPTSYW